MATPVNPLKMPRGQQIDRSPAMDNSGGEGGKMSADAAGYMELDGAQKDGDCTKVEVEGGVSKELGCCNEFDPQPQTQKFSCGTCTFVEPSTETAASVQPVVGGPSQPVITGQPS